MRSLQDDSAGLDAKVNSVKTRAIRYNLRALPDAKVIFRSQLNFHLVTVVGLETIAGLQHLTAVISSGRSCDRGLPFDECQQAGTN